MWFIKKNSYPYPLKLEMNEDQIWKKKKQIVVLLILGHCVNV